MVSPKSDYGHLSLKIKKEKQKNDTERAYLMRTEVMGMISSKK